RFSRLDLLKLVYGTVRDYESLPRSADGVAKLLYRYAPTGRVSILALQSGDDVEVKSQHFNYDGVFSSDSRNRVGMLEWQQAAGKSVALSGSLSAQGYESGVHYGVLDRTQHENNVHARLDGSWEPSQSGHAGFGFSSHRLGAEIRAASPADSTDLGPGAATRLENTRPRALVPGMWSEYEWRVIGPIYATLGARAD